MSGETALCMADMTVISCIPASATVVLMLRNSQVTVTVDRQRVEGGRLRERDGVRAQLSAGHGLMIITVLQAAVARQNETETDIPAVKEVAGLQIGVPTVTMKNLGTATASDGAIGRDRENTVTRRVEAAMDHTHVKIASLGQQKIEGHLLQTVGDQHRQN